MTLMKKSELKMKFLILKPINNAALPLFFLILAFVSSESTKSFRYSINYHWIYTTGWVLNYLLVLVSLVFSINNVNNLISFWNGYKTNKKYFFLLLSSIPILLLLIIFTLIFFQL